MFFSFFFHMKILTFVFFNDTEVVFLKMIVLSEMFIGFWFVLEWSLDFLKFSFSHLFGMKT